MKARAAFKFATLLAFLATVIVSMTASVWYVNQPEVPAELLK